MLKRPSGLVDHMYKHSCCHVDQYSRSKASSRQHFTMREYVLAVRHEDLKKTWPFSQKHLRLWLDRGKEPLLPPLDRPRPFTDLLSSQVHLDSQKVSECKIVSREEESFATELQISSKEGSTLLEPEPDIKLIKTGNLPENQLNGTFTANGNCLGFKTSSIRESYTGKHSKSRKLRNQASEGKAGKRLLKSKIQRAVNEFNDKLLQVKGAADGRICSTSVDSSKEDALGQDLSPKESNKIGQHPMFTAKSGNLRSKNAKSKQFDIVDVQTQESITSLEANQILNLLKENEEARGKTKTDEGETSQAEYGQSTPESSQMGFDMEAEKHMGQSMEELMRAASEGMVKFPSTKSGDVEVGRKGVEINSGSILSDSLIPKVCPVCRKFASTSNTALNAHIDRCLTVGAPVLNSIRSQNCRPKQKVRSIADICAEAPASMLNQKVKKSWCSTLSSCSYDLKGRRIQQKYQISTLEKCELNRKLDAVKTSSKRKRTVSDSEDIFKYKRNSKKRKSRSTLGIKRKKQSVLDSDNHLSWETAKYTMTSVLNFPSKVQNSETHQFTEPSLEIPHPECKHIKVAQSPPLPQASRFTTKHRASFRRRKKYWDESHMAINHSGEYGKGLNMIDNTSQPVSLSSNNKETCFPPPYKENGTVIETRCVLLRNDGLQMQAEGQLLCGNVVSPMETDHTITNKDECIMSGQHSEMKKPAPPIHTEKPLSESQSTGQYTVKRIVCIDPYSHAAEAQNSGIIDEVQGHLDQNGQKEVITAIGGIVDSKTAAIVDSIKSTCLSFKETKKSSLSREYLPKDINNETEHHIFDDFMTGGSERVEEDENVWCPPSAVTAQEVPQMSFQCKSEELLASNRSMCGVDGNDCQSSKKEMHMNQHMRISGTIRPVKNPNQPKPQRFTEMIISITKPFVDRSCSVSDIQHLEENNTLVSAGSTTDNNADQMMLKAETSLTGIKASSEQITLNSFSAPFLDSMHLDYPKISKQTPPFLDVSSIEKRNLKDLTFQRLTVSSITTNQLMPKGISPRESFLSEKGFKNHSPAAGENNLNHRGCVSIGEEPVKSTKPLLAELNHDLTSLRMGLPSFSCLDFHCKTRNQQGSTTSKPCYMVQDAVNSTPLLGIVASVNTINSSSGVTSRTSSWTAAVKMASLGTQLWDMPGKSFLQLDSSMNVGPISELQPQNSGICSRPVPVVQKKGIPSTLGNHSTTDSLCTTVSHVVHNTRHMHQSLIKQRNSMETSCPSTLKMQGPLSMVSTSCTGKSNLGHEENSVQGHGNFGFNSIGIFSESGNAPLKTSLSSCIQSSADNSPGLHIENCTIHEGNQLASNDQRHNFFKFPMSPFEEEKYLRAQSSATDSAPFERSIQPAVIHIFGKPIFVLATEHEDVAHQAINHLEMDTHRKSACEVTTPLSDNIKEPLSASVKTNEHWYNHQNATCGTCLGSSTYPDKPSARLTSATMNMDFDKYLNERLDASQKMRGVVTIDAARLSESLSGKLATDVFNKENSESGKLEVSADGSFLILDNCIQNPEGQSNFSAGNCQTGTLSKAVQLKECSIRLGTSNRVSSSNIDYKKYDSSVFTCRKGESHSHFVKHPEVASYCTAHTTFSHESKAIPMGVNTHSSRIGNRTTNASSMISPKTATNASKSNLQSSVIVIEDDEGARNPIDTPIDQVPEYRLGAVCPAKTICRVLKPKHMSSFSETSSHIQPPGSTLLVPGSNLETQGRSWKKVQNRPTAISNIQLCDTSICEDQLQFDAPALSSI